MNERRRVGGCAANRVALRSASFFLGGGGTAPATTHEAAVCLSPLTWRFVCLRSACPVARWPERSQVKRGSYAWLPNGDRMSCSTNRTKCILLISARDPPVLASWLQYELGRSVRQMGPLTPSVSVCLSMQLSNEEEIVQSLENLTLTVDDGQELVLTPDQVRAVGETVEAPPTFSPKRTESGRKQCLGPPKHSPDKKNSHTKDPK
jgi:hypothetical protein